MFWTVCGQLTEAGEHVGLHCIVPGGGLSPACPGQRSGGGSWIACRPGFFLAVGVLSRLFRRLVLEKLTAAHQAGRLTFFGDHLPLADAKAFARHLRPLARVSFHLKVTPASSSAMRRLLAMATRWV